MSEKQPGPDEVTPEPLYRSRRLFLKTSILAATGLATAAAYRHFRPLSSPAPNPPLPEAKRAGGEDPATPYQDITHYNNFYEFSTDKEAVAEKAKGWHPTSWEVAVDGLVEKPGAFSLQDLSRFATEERIYRFRCVEAWSMVIPWQGFPLAALLEKAKPLASARYVAFTSFFDEQVMPGAGYAGIPFPYVEGLRLDEALHPLTLLATGIYGKPLLGQNGAPVRLVVPWKYGFKSIKSVVKISLTDQQPPTTWNLANSHEYGFYSNVNPAVDHPRWSQSHERRIGELGLRPTLPFNGYGKEVAHLYAGMDLREYF